MLLTGRFKKISFKFLKKLHQYLRTELNVTQTAIYDQI